MKSTKCIAFLIVLLFAVFSLTFTVLGQGFDCSAGLHDSFEVERVEPTTTSDGHVIMRCRICDFTYKRILFSVEHDWGPWTVELEPTCTTEGRRFRVCRLTPNNFTEYETIPALGHDHQTIVTPPTCDQAGIITHTCSRCEDTYTEPGENALGHDLVVATTQEPTCEEDGFVKYICSRNPEYSHTRYILAHGHELGEWTVEILPTQDTEGLEVRLCKTCGEHGEERTIKPLPTASLFNEIDVVTGGLSLGVAAFTLACITPMIGAIKKEGKHFENFQKKKELEEKEMEKFGFNKFDK